MKKQFILLKYNYMQYNMTAYAGCETDRVSLLIFIVSLLTPIFCLSTDSGLIRVTHLFYAHNLTVFAA